VLPPGPETLPVYEVPKGAETSNAKNVEEDDDEELMKRLRSL